MLESKIKVAFLSTYPPRECGIANFTHDLISELKKIPELDITVIALSDADYEYGTDVFFDLQQQDRRGYRKAAERLSESDVDLLVVEHEYGIFGGKEGSYLLDLVDRVKLPIVTTLHTVLASPNRTQRKVLAKLCRKSDIVVIMADNSRGLLKEKYGVDPSKTVMIPHGVPWLDLPSREELKKEMGFEGRTIVSTFGLLSPGKGLEYGIEAIEIVSRKHKDILYLILGQTHPVVKRQFGEAYRTGLEQMVQERNLQDNVGFINRYLTQEEIIRYLKLSDIYMTPYLGKEQAVSGTLAYAIAYGRVVVSTPYAYAEEMLAEGRGLLADFENGDSLARQLLTVLENPAQKEEMEEKTRKFGERMTWGNVAEEYRQVFTGLCPKRS
ncbi:MAG: glycosyltransferase [Firmicutes bacterium]|jgi:glycosyltransferase involved in cell wall biosynthesis|nr:glycosyltransferase [Bacillota bacterium]